MHPNLAKYLKEISEIYWKEICALDINGKIEGDARKSIKTFISGYAYERKGAPKAYPEIAVEIIDLYFKDKIKNNDDATKYLEKRCEEKGIGPNRTNNIFYGGGKITILDFMDKINRISIEEWAKKCIEQEGISNTHREMCKIRGIGTKIASFYIRDIVYKYSLENNAKNAEKRLLHPIDIWVRRSGKILLNDSGKTDSAIQKFLVGFAEEGGITNTELNAGLWVLGARICKDKRRLESVIINTNIIKKMSRDRIKRNVIEIKALKKALESMD